MANKSVSYTQYSTWMNCPLEWKLKYVDGYKSDDGIAAVFGTAMHETIQEYLRLLYTEEKLKSRTFDADAFLKEKLMELFSSRMVKLNENGIKEYLTSKDILLEHYVDGCNILEHVRKYASSWFPTKNYELIGIEIPLEYDLGKNLTFKGFIDIVVKDASKNIIYIYDFKTSTRGWTYQRSDYKKTDQLLLYKKFYADLYNVPLENIHVEFLILKRKISDSSNFVVKHVGGFSPSHGKPSMKKAIERFDTFVNKTFDDNGNVNLQNIKATPTENSCRYCAFNNNSSLCKVSYYLKDKIITND